MRYLSDAWFDAATAAMVGCDPVDPPVRIGYHVLGGPDGDRSHRLVLGSDGISFEQGLDETDVVMTLAYDLAAAIAAGRTSAQRAFLDGQIRLGGDVTALLGSGDALADVDDRLADLRSVTTFR